MAARIDGKYTPLTREMSNLISRFFYTKIKQRVHPVSSNNLPLIPKLVLDLPEIGFASTRSPAASETPFKVPPDLSVGFWEVPLFESFLSDDINVGR